MVTSAASYDSTLRGKHSFGLRNGKDAILTTQEANAGRSLTRRDVGLGMRWEGDERELQEMDGMTAEGRLLRGGGMEYERKGKEREEIKEAELQTSPTTNCQIKFLTNVNAEILLARESTKEETNFFLPYKFLLSVYQVKAQTNQRSKEVRESDKPQPTENVLMLKGERRNSQKEGWISENNIGFQNGAMPILSQSRKISGHSSHVNPLNAVSIL
uniref:Uncharacterized protein n=1 Tax=Parascaris univalens TaxID=6257 RepID=A0A915BSA0_PARUN